MKAQTPLEQSAEMRYDESGNMAESSIHVPTEQLCKQRGESMEPRIKTHLCISGDALNFDDITNYLNILPSAIRHKDDFPEISRKMGLAKDEWIYSTWKTECRAISVQIDALEKTFEKCIDKLNKICEKFDAKITIIIVIEMEAGEHPELCLTKTNINFISSIHSELGIDPYINICEE